VSEALSSTTVDPTAQNFYPISSEVPLTNQYGPLEPHDLEWTIGSGFNAETQVWYHGLDNGTFLLFQIIHSSIG
jgi:hypothetical protein